MGSKRLMLDCIYTHHGIKRVNVGLCLFISWVKRVNVGLCLYISWGQKGQFWIVFIHIMGSIGLMLDCVYTYHGIKTVNVGLFLYIS